MNRRLSLVVPVSLALFTACGGGTRSDDVVALIRAEQYDQALRLAAERAADNPDDAEAAGLHRSATVVWHLDHGRQALFERRLEDALDDFNLALELEPRNVAVIEWIMKTRDELTALWLDRGLDFLIAAEWESALEAYELAEYYTPRHPEALFGATRVLFLINYHQGLGEDYYNQGVRAMHGHYLTEARHKFWASEKYTEDDESAQERRGRVEAALAEERLFVAETLEGEGNFGAAQIEYRVILKIDPENQTALDGLDRMTHEVEATRLLAEADKLIRQRRFEEALLKLAEGSELTSLQTDHFTRMESEIEVAHWEALYRRGLDEEQDFRYAEAVQTYAQLLEEAEFYEDAEQRKATLEDYIARAEALYAELEAAGTPDEELAILREIELFWPEYSDVQERLSALR